jgi:hypothetical protein
VRHHLVTGRIPADSRVRRSPDDDWASLEKTPEFADLVTHRPVDGNTSPPQPASAARPSATSQEPVTLATRLDPQRLHTLGVRGLAQELLAALDSTLVRRKLAIAGAAGLVSSVVLALAESELGGAAGSWRILRWGLAFLALAPVAAVVTALLTQMTYVELSRLRPARWDEARAGLKRFAARLTLAYLLVGSVMVLDLVGVRNLPSWLLRANEAEGWAWFREAAVAAATVLALLLEVILWPLLGFALLLGPVVVIEECSVGAALGQWWQLLRQHLGRIFLYEALAAALGVVATLPFAIPVLLATLGASAAWDYLPWRFTAWLLSGLAAAPLLAYLVVANVFIYLNLRYEQGTRR